MASCTVVTIALWFLMSGGHSEPIAYVDKLVEGALVVLLLVEGWLLSRRKSAPKVEPGYETAHPKG